MSINAQIEKLNDYKYVIIPEKFDFVNESDKYQTSSLTKFLLKKNNFNVFLSDENLPKDLTQNRCLAITANVVDKSGMFNTKNAIEFTDCNGSLIYNSQLGTSKHKEYKKAYHQAIRKAHSDMIDFKYSYKKKEASPIQKVIKTPVNEKKVPVIITNTKKNTVVNKTQEKKVSKEILYAQSKANGFQLINTKPEVVFILLNTDVKDVYIIKGKNGILYKNSNSWIAEFYENNQFIKKEYLVKF